MPRLNDLTTGVYDRLIAAQNAGGSLFNNAAAVVLREDVHDLQTEINKAIGQIGMLILVGMPHFLNESKLATNHLEVKIGFAVAIGEHPILWRKNSRDSAGTVALIVAQLLHGLQIAGFNKLRVARTDFIPDKKRQLYEVAVETLFVSPALAI